MGIIQKIKTFFSSTSSNISNFINADIHSHLLPGIDDGVKSFEESIELIKKYQSLGYKKLIITPHVMYDSYNNSSELIIQKIEELKAICNKKNITIELEASAEYFLDEEFEKRIEGNDLLPIKNKYILFETSYYQKPLNLKEIVFKILSKGYTPVLAHPERYRYINNLDEYGKLKELGLLFQCNIISFSGFYGKNAYKKFIYLTKNKMIDFLGSDAHSIKYLNALEETLKNKNFYRVIRENNILNNIL